MTGRAACGFVIAPGDAFGVKSRQSGSLQGACWKRRGCTPRMVAAVDSQWIEAAGAHLIKRHLR